MSEVMFSSCNTGSINYRVTMNYASALASQQTSPSSTRNSANTTMNLMSHEAEYNSPHSTQSQAPHMVQGGGKVVFSLTGAEVWCKPGWLTL